MNKYGCFSDKDREFVISTPDTPSPWINYLFGRNLNAFISQAAGGCAWFSESDIGRLTRYRFNGLPVDSPGFYIYITDAGQTWNPSFRPTLAPLDSFSCAHGLGYTRFESSKNALNASVNYFIPYNENVFIWDLKLRNDSQEAKEIRLLTYLEFSLNVMSKDTEAYLVCGNQWRINFDEGLNAAHVDYFAFGSPLKTHSFFASSEKVSAFELDREEFTGKGRSEANPAALARRLGNSQIPDGGAYPCGCLENKINLAPGEEKRITYKFASAENKAEAETVLGKFSVPCAVDSAFRELRSRWNDKLEVMKIETPDSDINAFVETWLPYNTNVTAAISRSISSRHVGSGGAIRFRDTMQDLMPETLFSPGHSRKMILKVYQTMLKSGRTIMGVSTRTMTSDNPDFTRGDAALWGVYTVHKYLSETGDFSILDEIVPYFDGGRGTVLEHMERGLSFTAENCGSNGIPLLFDVDWNDMLQIFTHYEKGPWESVMIAEQFIYAASLMREILESVDKKDFSGYLEAKSAKFAQILESDLCWDGKWFRRLLLFDKSIGGTNNEEGKIFLNTQSWAVLCGRLDSLKCRTAMNSVEELLDSRYGIRIFSPPFTKKGDGSFFDSNLGGAGENGGIFLHANTWAIIAEALLGNNKTAWKYFSQILPPKRSAENADLYSVEPYAFTSWAYGPGHSLFGKGQLSWLTGGAAWLHIAASEYILGVKPGITGLAVNPVIPEQWSGFSVHRKVRGKICRIDVGRISGSSGLDININGNRIENNFIPYGKLNPAS